MAAVRFLPARRAGRRHATRRYLMPSAKPPPALDLGRRSRARPAGRHARRGGAAPDQARPTPRKPRGGAPALGAQLHARRACRRRWPAWSRCRAAHLSPWPHLLGYASLGALAALFGRFESPARRRAVVLQCGLLLAGAVLAMSASATLGASASAMLLVLAALCGLFFHGRLDLATGHAGRAHLRVRRQRIDEPGGPVGRRAARAAATAAASIVAWLICALTDRWRHQVAPPAEPARPLAHRLVAAGASRRARASPRFAA